jgi:hypothetical protein
VSELENLEEIAQQTTIVVNKHDRPGRGKKAGHFSHLPENIARAAVRLNG